MSHIYVFNPISVGFSVGVDKGSGLCSLCGYPVSLTWFIKKTVSLH